MHEYSAAVALSACLFFTASLVIGKEGDEVGQRDEKEERKSPGPELRIDPRDRPEGPAKTDPSEHINEHLRGQELLDLYPVEIPDRIEKKK